MSNYHRERESRARLAENELRELQAELAAKIAQLIGPAERLATGISRLTLHQRTAPTAACPVTYEPSIIVVPQGRKHIQIGSKEITHDSSRYLLTSVDLPAVARVIEASSEVPCFAATLKLDIAVVREFLSREDFHTLDSSPESPAMSTGPVTAQFLRPWFRLLDLLSHAEDIPFLSGFVEREIVYRVLRGPEGQGCGQSLRRATKATELRKPSPGSRRTMRSHFDWKSLHKLRVWLCLSFTTISERSRQWARFSTRSKSGCRSQEHGCSSMMWMRRV